MYMYMYMLLPCVVLCVLCLCPLVCDGEGEDSFLSGPQCPVFIQYNGMDDCIDCDNSVRSVDLIEVESIVSS